MSPTTILCAGMFRSGSTWTFNVTKALLAAADPNAWIEAGYYEGEELEDMLSTHAPQHRVIKCHFGSDAVKAAVDAGTVHRVIYSQRDPMAALASCVEQFCSRLPFSEDWTFEVAVERVGQAIGLGVELRSMPDVLFTDLHRNGEEYTLGAISAHLGIELPDQVMGAILDQFTFEHMRERSDSIAAVSPEDLFRGINDPETLMHAHHVDKGVGRDWTAELTLDQAMYASEVFARFSREAGRRSGDSGQATTPSARDFTG